MLLIDKGRTDSFNYVVMKLVGQSLQVGNHLSDSVQLCKNKFHGARDRFHVEGK